MISKKISKTIALCIMAALSSVALYAQTTVSGTVTDPSGDPIIGATVLIPGTTRGTSTDTNGAYSINVDGADFLEFTCIGYKSQQIRLSGQAVITVVLEEETTFLDDVVVVGYGVQKKVDVTGAVSMIDAEVLEARPVANVNAALQGVIPGLNLTTTSNGGDLNSPLSLNIRGTGSLSSNDDPLVLIDGIEGDLTTLNPNDIESISVLKDAASASIYGSRAAFGVVLVTTKSGQSGKTRVTYSGDVRFSSATNLPHMADSYTWATYFNDCNINAGAGSYFSDEVMQKILNFQAGMYTDPTTPEYYGASLSSDGTWASYGNAFANTDWFKEFYKKNVPSTQHNLSLSGGTDKLNWLVSGSFLMENGLLRHGHDELDRYTINAKIGAKLAKWANMDYSIKWTRKDYEKPAYIYEYGGLFFHNIARRWPTCYPVDPNGHWQEGMEVNELENGGVYTQNYDYFTQQLKFVFEPIKDWHINVDGSISINNQKEYESCLPIYSYYADNTPYMSTGSWVSQSEVYENRFRSNYYTVNIYSDYSHTWGKHHGRVMVGVNYERYDQDNLWGDGYDLTTSDTPYISQTQSDFRIGGNYWHRATAGYFGRINYDYDERYLLEFNIRYDGSSRFVGSKRWAWFPSVSAGYNIARENFFKDATNVVSMLKLRASWGQLGNTNSNYSSFSDWYPFYQQQSLGSSNSGWLIDGARQNTASLPSIVSTEQTWETIETWDVGLDWALFDNRLTGTFDWYTRTTKDMIGPAPTLGSALGASAPQVNNCDMRSNGWELEISWRDQVGDWSYGARFNISDARQKILRYPNETGDLSTYYAGMYLGEIWGYTTHGIANSQQEMDNWIANNNPNWGSNWGAGDIMYTDLNGDGVVNNGDNTLDNHGDMKIIGNSTPRYRVGLNLEVAWKGIDFSVFFQGVLKRDYAFDAGDPYFWGSTGNVWQSCCFEEHMDYWREDNMDAYYPKPYFGSIQKNQRVQTRYLQSAAYLRCKNMQIGYTLPQRISQKFRCSNCRVYVSCDNLFTISGLLSVYDPEAMGSYENYGTSGKTYPLQRTWAIGLTLSF